MGGFHGQFVRSASEFFADLGKLAEQVAIHHGSRVEFLRCGFFRRLIFLIEQAGDNLPAECIVFLDSSGAILAPMCPQRLAGDVQFRDKTIQFFRVAWKVSGKGLRSYHPGEHAGFLWIDQDQQGGDALIPEQFLQPADLIG
ncbi:MAG: hypothetical protein NTV46_18640 [Verrucomicrobia bacterium]|nr:hypothetical protein [Verrucomicrobiota bacterium]